MNRKYIKRFYVESSGRPEHEERMSVEEARIAADVSIEHQRIESRNKSLSMLPQTVGEITVSALSKRGNKIKPLRPRRGAPPVERVTLLIEKSNDIPHGPITIKCPTCQKYMTLLTSNSNCQCASCNTKYDIKSGAA